MTIIPPPDKASSYDLITWAQMIRGVSFYSCGKSCKSGTSSDASSLSVTVSAFGRVCEDSYQKNCSVII